MVAQMLNPYPFIQVLYAPTKSPHSFWGSSLLLKSIHSSLAAFSSLHTQQGFTFAEASPAGLREEAMFVVVEASVRGVVLVGLRAVKDV